MSAVECSGLSKTFDGKKCVLEEVDLCFEEGECVIISGPSGAGKTTLLSILGGYLAPTKGTVLLFGHSLLGMGFSERAQFRRDNLGVVFQEGKLIDSLTVLDNVIAPLLSTKDSKKIAYLKAMNALNYMGMDGKKDCYLSELSGSEIALVSLSRALVNQPKLLFLDEPTQFLDHKTAVKVMTYLRQMAMDHQITIVTVLNDVRLFPFASQVIRMKGGKIVDALGESLIDTPFLRI